MSSTVNVVAATKTKVELIAGSKVIANFGMKRVVGASAILKNSANVHPDLSTMPLTLAGTKLNYFIKIERIK